MTSPIRNILRGPPASREEERTQDLVVGDGFLLERIVSLGQVTPSGQWFDQSRDEWVLLLSGAARIRIQGELTPLELRPGDYLCIPAHRRHRVDWTDPDTETVWLALHYRNSSS